MEAILQSGPHIHSGDATRLRMTDGAIALLPLTAGALWFFGWSAVWRLAVSLASCLSTEILWERLGKRGHPADGSALVTALLFFLSLPGRSPWWAVLLGGAAAISSKAVFGGLGKNFFNPAALGRVLLLPLLSSPPLRTAKGTFLMAYTGGAFGEVSTLLLLCGAIYLALRRLLPWAITLPYLAAAFCSGGLLSLSGPGDHAPGSAAAAALRRLHRRRRHPSGLLRPRSRRRLLRRGDRQRSIPGRRTSFHPTMPMTPKGPPPAGLLSPLTPWARLAIVQQIRIIPTIRGEP